MRFLCLVFIVILNFTQNSTAQDFGKLWVGGRNVFVIYNTLKQYEDGITLTDYTWVKASIKCPSCVTPTGKWEIRMFARTDALNYQGGESGVDDIEFADLEITVKLIGTPLGVTANSPFTLEQATHDTSDLLVLIEGTGGLGIGATDPPFEFEFTISYNLPNPMTNRTKEGGLFYTVIELFLIDIE